MRFKFFVIAWIAIAVESITVTRPSAAQDVANTPSPLAIDEQLKALNLTPRTVELTSEKAARFRHQIEQGRYAEARALIGQVLDESNIQNWRFYPFSDFIAQAFNLVDPAFKDRLDAWVAQDERDPLRILVRAQYFYDLGWFQRGHQFSQYVEASHVAAFKDSIGKALYDIDAALDLSDANPYGFYLKLRILQAMGASAKLMETFRQGEAKYPDYYPLYDAALHALAPKWGGSVDAMYAFVDTYAGHAPENSPLRLLYVSLYRDLLDAAAVACRDYRNDRDKAVQCVRTAMQKFTAPKLDDEVLTGLRLYDQAPYQFGVAVQPILFDMLRNSNADSYAGALLQRAATAMHSDTTLKDDGPDSNDYVIDRALGESWRQKGVYEAAAKKTQKALQDAMNASFFPNEEARDAALGLIYGDMAGQAARLSQYVDLIAYETAAVKTGGPNSYEQAICYGFYQLKQVAEAVRSCSQTIADQPNNIYAYYWRGMAYRDLMQPDAALGDLGVVAATENSFRASAAITMSLIDFDREDNAAALDLLKKYSFLYDPNVQSKSTVATAYNNRCYAYMQLGDLEKALSDCTASLQYGSIPDAYRKQQELVKRLSPRVSSP
jgi:hypothetical protein